MNSMPGGTGAFGAFGGLIMAASLLLSLRKQPPGPVGRLAKAGATSPEQALKPSTAGIVRPVELRPAIRRGLVHELDDGRLWVDVARVRRRRIRIAVFAGLATMLVIELLWLFLRSVKAI